MADYAGAVAAVKAYFTSNWTATPYGFVNEAAPVSTYEDGTLRPWVLFELVHAGSTIMGSGTPGQQTIVYDGIINAHVFVEKGSGDADGLAKAIAIGELFRNKVLYDAVTAGCFVRTGFDRNGVPRIDSGDITSDDGKWFTVTAAIPWEYWHRG